jgi:hypothetical protein
LGLVVVVVDMSQRPLEAECLLLLQQLLLRNQHLRLLPHLLRLSLFDGDSSSNNSTTSIKLHQPLKLQFTVHIIPEPDMPEPRHLTRQHETATRQHETAVVVLINLH